MVRRSIKSSASIVALHKAIEKPIGYPVNRSLINPSGAAHQAGQGSDRSSRQPMKARKPKSGYQPLVETIGKALSRLAAMTVAVGTYAARREGPLPMRRGEASAARAIQGVSAGDEAWSAATASGSNGGSTIAKLTFDGSARGIAIAPSSSSFTIRAIGTSGG